MVFSYYIDKSCKSTLLFSFFPLTGFLQNDFDQYQNEVKLNQREIKENERKNKIGRSQRLNEQIFDLSQQSNHVEHQQDEYLGGLKSILDMKMININKLIDDPNLIL